MAQHKSVCVCVTSAICFFLVADRGNMSSPRLQDRQRREERETGVFPDDDVA